MKQFAFRNEIPMARCRLKAILFTVLLVFISSFFLRFDWRIVRRDKPLFYSTVSQCNWENLSIQSKNKDIPFGHDVHEILKDLEFIKLPSHLPVIQYPTNPSVKIKANSLKGMMFHGIPLLWKDEHNVPRSKPRFMVE